MQPQQSPKNKPLPARHPRTQQPTRALLQADTADYLPGSLLLIPPPRPSSSNTLPPGLEGLSTSLLLDGLAEPSLVGDQGYVQATINDGTPVPDKILELEVKGGGGRG